MSLAPGARLGPYEVLSAIGAGGMGEVYRARDTRLKRDVAIKVLPDAFAKDADRLARFQREAEVLASLNHPNIAGIYGLERAEGQTSLVMELVEGPTLADRISQGTFPVDETLPIAKQIAEALEAAHEQGIIHRDLKPANIKVRPDGTVKVLDFGLAKAVASELSQVNASLSPTITSPAMTAGGVILGTAAYMSPEQAKGKPVDKRTDIWAFGCVLYEMLTGRRPFVGEDVTETMAFVLTRDVSWAALPASTPPALVELLKRCLVRDPRERLRDIGEARIRLSHMRLDDRTAPRAARETRRLVTWQMIGIGLGAAAISAWLTQQIGPARDAPPDEVVPPPIVRTIIDLPLEASLSVGARVPLIGFESPSLALSPDGRQLVYVGKADDDTRLYFRDMNSFDAPHAIAGTEGALFAFFSPDGREVGFLTPDRVKKTSLESGSVITLCRARTPVTATWTSGNRIYFSENQGRTISRVADSGGEPSELFSFPAFRFSIGQVLPDGRAALVTVGSESSVSADYASLQLLTLDDLKLRPMISPAYDGRYVSSGHIVFARTGTLFAVPFDLERLEVTGEAVSLVRGAGMDSLFRTVHAAVSTSGTLAYVAGGDIARGKIAWIDRSGSVHSTDVPERVYGVFDVSDDDRWIAAVVPDVISYVWIWDAASKTGQVLASPALAALWDSAARHIAVFPDPSDLRTRD